ncbi:MAG: heme ABC transporter ATP-binding protein [Pseudorhodoferax sp.]
MVGGKTLLQPTDLRLVPGRVTAILGPNGAGKSTLLALLSGERRPSRGRVLLDGQDLAGMAPAALALRRAVMAQEAPVAFDFLAREVVELGRYPHRLRPSADEAGIVAQAMRDTGVAHLADRVFNSLSGGEKARVHLARALAQGGRWLLLDEPTAALDLAHQHQALQLLRRLAHAQGLGVVLVLHDLNLALRYADGAVLLADAALQAAGPVREVLTPERVLAVWGVQCSAAAAGDGMLQYLFG